MADGTRGEDRKPDPADEALSARLKRLGEGLDRTVTHRTAESEPGPRQGSDPSALARALRLSAEMVAGVVVGAGLGLLLDRFAGTSPWGFIVLLLLGFAGGVLTVMRSAGVLPKSNP
jgi:ATP synthase protein I